MSKYPNIPDFHDVDSMRGALRAMKDIVEQLAGQRQGEALGSPTMFVQSSAPRVTLGVTLRRGDLWVDESANRLYYYSGSVWKQIVA
jgi:hypothetical protein